MPLSWSSSKTLDLSPNNTTLSTLIQRVHDHLVLFFVLLTGKLYVFGMLRTLNSRVKLRERMKSHDLGRTSLENWSWEQSMSGGRAPSLLREVFNFHLSHDSISEVHRAAKQPSKLKACQATDLLPIFFLTQHRKNCTAEHDLLWRTIQIRMTEGNLDSTPKSFLISNRRSLSRSKNCHVYILYQPFSLVFKVLSVLPKY